MKSVGLLVNKKKDTNHAAAARIVAALRKSDARVFADIQTALALHIEDILDFTKIEILFILGGDGTILRAAADCARNRVKIMGFDLGRLGFLTEAEIPDIEDAIVRVMDGRYEIERRMMLRTEVCSAQGKTLLETVALNDAVITKQNLSRLIDIELHVNDHLADAFAGDGIILSTPTGSTGYSISAGGPIICPNLECIVATPICPHSMYSRSIVLRCSDVIEIRQKARIEGAVLSVDGSEAAILGPGDIIRVSKSSFYSEFIRINGMNFHSLLRRKLAKWNESDD